MTYGVIRMGRISTTVPLLTPGTFAAHSSTGSMLGASRMKKPESCSLESTNGPFCTTRLPFVIRMVVAAATAWAERGLWNAAPGRACATAAPTTFHFTVT